MNLSESSTLIATVLQANAMDASAVATISALTVALVQIIKRSTPDSWSAYGPLIALVVSLAGVLLWLYSAPAWPPARTDAWQIGVGWVAVYTSAVGVYHTVRMVTKTDTEPEPDPPAAPKIVVP